MIAAVGGAIGLLATLIIITIFVKRMIDTDTEKNEVNTGWAKVAVGATAAYFPLNINCLSMMII